jgi:hypothetical protein
LYERLLVSRAFDGKQQLTLYHYHEELEDSDSFLVVFFNQFLSPEQFEECYDLLQELKAKKDYKPHKGYSKSDTFNLSFDNFEPL